MFARKTVLL